MSPADTITAMTKSPTLTATPLQRLLGEHLRGVAEQTLAGWGLRPVPGIRLPADPDGSVIAVYFKPADEGTGRAWCLVVRLDTEGQLVGADVCADLSGVFEVAERLMAAV